MGGRGGEEPLLSCWLFLVWEEDVLSLMERKELEESFLQRTEAVSARVTRVPESSGVAGV